MNSLNDIKEEIESTKEKTNKEIETLKEKASSLFSKLMDKKEKAIDAMVSALDNSKDLTGVPNDEYFHRFARTDFSKLIDTKDEFQKELLSDYLSENHCIYVDFENDCVTTAEGPCILINHKGDVLDQDSGKWFISKKDYETEEERNKLIEAYMEKSGFFPSVIEVDYHGNAFYRSTLAKEDK